MIQITIKQFKVLVNQIKKLKRERDSLRIAYDSLVTEVKKYNEAYGGK